VSFGTAASIATIELQDGEWTQTVKRNLDGRMSRRVSRIGRTSRRMAA
jgi:hypothetical protein